MFIVKVKDEKGKWFLGTTKTINGVRKVYICDILLTTLKNYNMLGTEG